MRFNPRNLFRPDALFIGAAIAIVAGIGAYHDHEVAAARDAIDSYSTYDYRSGGYRALYAVLEREGTHVERFEAVLTSLDAKLDTLVYADPLPGDPRQIAPTRNELRALTRWVRAGGRLVYLGFDDAAAHDGFLRLPASHIGGSRAARPFVAPSLRAAGVAPIKADNARRWSLQHRTVETLLGDARGPIVVRYRYGHGVVLAIIDRRLFSNAALHGAAPARMAVALLTPSRPHGRVAFDEAVHGYRVATTIWNLFPRTFWIAMIVAATALFIAFFGASIRLGPAVVPPRRDDRSSGDFIDALASLLGRNRAVRPMALAAARSTTAAIARALRLEASAPIATIATAIDDPQARAEFGEMHAVAERGFPDERTLVRAIALAQTLRKDFDGHGPARN